MVGRMAVEIVIVVAVVVVAVVVVGNLYGSSDCRFVCVVDY